MDHDLYVGLIATTAVARGMDHSKAWTLARSIAADIPNNLELATGMAVAQADSVMWPEGSV